MRADPVGQRLGPTSLAIGVAGGTQYRDEYRRFVHLAGHLIDDRHPVAGPVDEKLVARQMRLAHRGRETSLPFAVKLTVAAIPVAVGDFGTILLPQDHQRHVSSLQFLVHLRPVRQRSRWSLVKAGGCKQPRLQLGVADLRRDWPRDANDFGAGHELADGRFANPGGPAHLTDAELVLVCQAQNFANLPHRHPLRRHRLPPLFLLTEGADQLIRVSTGAMPARLWPAVPDHR